MWLDEIDRLLLSIQGNDAPTIETIIRVALITSQHNHEWCVAKRKDYVRRLTEEKQATSESGNTVWSSLWFTGSGTVITTRSKCSMDVIVML